MCPRALFRQQVVPFVFCEHNGYLQKSASIIIFLSSFFFFSTSPVRVFLDAILKASLRWNWQRYWMLIWLAVYYSTSWSYDNGDDNGGDVEREMAQITRASFFLWKRGKFSSFNRNCIQLGQHLHHQHKKKGVLYSRTIKNTNRNWYHLHWAHYYPAKPASWLSDNKPKQFGSFQVYDKRPGFKSH